MVGLVKLKLIFIYVTVHESPVFIIIIDHVYVFQFFYT